MTLPSRRDRVLGGRYLLVEPVGHGGTAVVWRAHDRVLDRSVAVKILSDGSERLRERLRSEATAVGRLRNAHIAHIYDYGETVAAEGQTVPYLVMELVDGEPLSRLLTREASLPWPDAVDIVAQVAAAVAVAHAEGLVHRDIKPDNVLLTQDGVKLIDFGISALVGSPDIEEDGYVLGTVAYLAPERLIGSRVGPSADVYALGVLLYRMIAGTLPWPVRDQADLLEAHVQTEPARLTLTGDMPAALAAICADCLRKEPEGRPSAAELAGALAGLSGSAAGPSGSPALGASGIGEATNGSVVVAPVAEPVTGRHRGRRTIGVLAAAAAGVALALVVWTGGGGSPRAAAGTPPANVPCVANFAITRDWGSGFDASLTIVNMGAAVQGWRIAFNFTGDQQIAAGPAAEVTVTAEARLRQEVVLRQSGATVLAAAPDQTLRRHDSVTLPVSGRYTGTNPIPLDFWLNDQACAAQVSGAAGHPTPAPGGTTPPIAGSTPAGPTSGPTVPGLPIPGSTDSGTTAPGSPPGSTTETPPSSPPPPNPHPTPDPPGGGGGHGKPSSSPKPTHDHKSLMLAR